MIGRITFANMLMMLALVGGPACAQAAAASDGSGLWQEAERVMLIPWVTFALLTLGMSLLILDLLTINTWGVSGTAGVACLALVFAAYISAGVASWVGVTVFLLGLGLILMEAHVFPGHGISGIGGMIGLFLGLFWALGGMAVNALFAGLTSAFFTLMAVAAFLVYLPKTTTWRRLGQRFDQMVGTYTVSTEDAREYVGSTGKAVTALKPTGAGEFRGRRLEVVSESGYIPPASDIRAVRLEGDRLIVRDASLEAERHRQVTLGE